MEMRTSGKNPVQQFRFWGWLTAHQVSAEILAEWMTMTFEMLKYEKMITMQYEEAVKPTIDQMQDAIAQLFPS